MEDKLSSALRNFSEDLERDCGEGVTCHHLVEGG